MRRVVRYMHNICTIHIRRNCVHGCLKLLVVNWLGLIALQLGLGLGLGLGQVMDITFLFFPLS